MNKRYSVKRCEENRLPLVDWDSPAWSGAETLDIAGLMGPEPLFRPVTQARLLYNSEALHVIFRVQDRYVRGVTKEINGPVWEDSCVELFFAPDGNLPLRYFNLEVNCVGTALMHYNRKPREDQDILDPALIRKIKIASSLKGPFEEERTGDLNWTLAYALPFDLMQTHVSIDRPEPDVQWKANLYKCADKSSNPHFLTWSPVRNAVPDFHLPAFFGDLLFS